MSNLQADKLFIRLLIYCGGTLLRTVYRCAQHIFMFRIESIWYDMEWFCLQDMAIFTFVI